MPFKKGLRALQNSNDGMFETNNFQSMYTPYFLYKINTILDGLSLRALSVMFSNVFLISHTGW